MAKLPVMARTEARNMVAIINPRASRKLLDQRAVRPDGSNRFTCESQGLTSLQLSVVLGPENN